MSDTTITTTPHDSTAFYQVECPDCKEKDAQLAAARAEIERLRRLAYVPGHEPNEDGESETWAEAFADTDMLRKEAKAEAAAERERADHYAHLGERAGAVEALVSGRASGEFR